MSAARRSQPGGALRRSRSVHGARNDTATMSSYDGRSRCQPMPAPGAYSVTMTCSNGRGRLATDVTGDLEGPARSMVECVGRRAALVLQRRTCGQTCRCDGSQDGHETRTVSMAAAQTRQQSALLRQGEGLRKVAEAIGRRRCSKQNQTSRFQGGSNVFFFACPSNGAWAQCARPLTRARLEMRLSITR